MKRIAFRIVAGFMVMAAGMGISGRARNVQVGTASPESLLPRVAGWTSAEAVQKYRPESLYEYIDGAAEAYLSYDFRELAVGQFRAEKSKAQVTAEIYDMGSSLNAFGIYSAERYPESRFLDVGVQGYVEEGSLNLLAGAFYIKLMCYEGGDQNEAILKQYAGAIVSKIKAPGAFPALLQVFPRDGLIANSEKFVLRNVLGYKFLSAGYTAAYSLSGRDFEAFVIEAKSASDAGAMLAGVVENFVKNGRPVETKGGETRIKDSYLKNVFLSASGRYLCGVIKIADGSEALGERTLAAMAESLRAAGKR